MGSKKAKPLPPCDGESGQHQLARETFQCMFRGNCELRPLLCPNCSYVSPLDPRLRFCKRCYVSAKLNMQGNEMQLSDEDLRP